MQLILIACIIGIILRPCIGFYLYMAFLLLVFIACFWLKIDYRKVIIILSCSLIFYVYTGLEINKFDTKYADGSIEMQLEIISSKEETEYYDKYVGKNDARNKFMVFVPKGEIIKKGTKIFVDGEFKLPEKARNTGGYDYRRYLNSQGIFGNIYAKKYNVIEIPKFNLIYWIQDELYNSFAKLFPKEELGLVMGMMIGDTKDIPDNVQEDFKQTGITHLIAVSGSNVAYVVTLVETVFKRIIGVRGSYFVSIVALILFMFVSGASSSVVRATIMLMLQILANIFYRKSDTNFNICFSAIVLLIISPLTIYDVGFILSFGGTIGIIQFSKILLIKLKRFGAIAETLSVTISAQLVLIPIMMYYFNTFSIISILPNLVVVPISGTITILGFAVFILSKINFTLAKCVGYTLYILALFTIKVAELFSKIPFANMQTITPNIFEIVIFYLIIFYLSGKFDSLLFHENKQYRFIESKPKKKSLKLVAILVSIFIFVELIIYNLPHSYVEVHCIDVGQGDAFYIRAKNKNILIDGGGSDTYDVGTNVLIPYLLDKRLMNIDTVFISHSDSDHLNGILSALENFKVGKIIIAKNSLGFEKVFEVAHKKNIDIIEVLKGDSIKIGNVEFEVISPDSMIDNNNVNEYSLVVKMIYGNESMLFTGDIGADTESKLFNVDADILKVGHHGSKNSSSQKFIHEVSPDLAIIEVGKDNKYGHPNDEVIMLLEKYSKVLTTAKHGEIIIKIYKNKIKYNTFID